MASYERNNFAVQENTVSLDNFKILKKLGQGSYGKVFLVAKIGGHDHGKLYAMKAVNKNPNKGGAQRVKLERDVLVNAYHPFVMTIYYAFQTEEKVYLVLELHEGGDLAEHIRYSRNFSEEEVVFYLAELVLAIDHIHKLHVLHRDLKPGNVLIGDDGHLVLADFGLCGWDKISKDECGTQNYMAPEMFHGLPQTRAVDWWSFGCIMSVMFTGKTGFEGPTKEDTMRNILTKEVSFPSHMSADAVSLMKGLLVKNPRHRVGSGKMGAEDITSHPFFKKVDWYRVAAKEYTSPYLPKVERKSFDQRIFQSTYSSSISGGKSKAI